MLILGLETATDQVGCAVAGHRGVLASVHSARPRRHAETLMPSVEFACRVAGVELRAVNAVAVDIGPGLFTGLRVGVATAKAIAFALRVPVIGVTSLDLLAFPLRFGSRPLAAVVDARRGEVFFAFYLPVPGGVQRMSDPAVGTADDLASELLAAGDDHLVVGDGALRYAERLRGLDGTEIVEQHSLAHPSATALVELARARALREEWERPEEVRPLYVRLPDAEINWSTRAGRGDVRAGVAGEAP